MKVDGDCGKKTRRRAGGRGRPGPKEKIGRRRRGDIHEPEG